MQLTTPSLKRNIIEETDQIIKQIQAQSQNKRIPQPMLLYILVTTSQLITVFLSILLLIISAQYKKNVYLTYIIATVVRVSIFFIDSVYIIGFNRQLFRHYFLLDNVIVAQIASCITYSFLNIESKVEYVLGAIICYPILLFFLVGNFRVMLRKCLWKKWQVIYYKLIKLLGATYFLVYGSYVLLYSQTSNTDQFLLWIFTTCGFWGEMCSAINNLDNSANLVFRYALPEE